MKKSIYKAISLKLILAFLFQLSVPSISFALTGGPSQPEVQGFTPIGTSEMVNLFSGDFNYNIPLIDIDGYPINLSYSSGVSMEQEASWVGLGWSVNVGTINRSMRGLPDDFNGDQVTKVMNMKPTRTVGVSGGLGGLEIFGANAISTNISAGFSFNNYNGFGFQKTVSMSFNASLSSRVGLNAGLGITSDTNEGISVQPSLSLSMKCEAVEHVSTKFGLSIGTSFNSRSGLKQLTITKSISTNIDNAKDDAGNIGNRGSSLESSSSFNVGTPTYSPSAGPSMSNTSISGRFTMGAEAFGAHANGFVNAYYSSQSLSATQFSNGAYGYMYSEEGQNNSKALLDFNREKDVPFVNGLEVLPITNFTYDIFSVSGQGTGGSFRTFRSEIGHVYDPYTTSGGSGDAVGVEAGVGNLAHSGGSLDVNQNENTVSRWTSNNQAKNTFKFNSKIDGSTFEPFYFKEANERGVQSDEVWIDKLGGYEPVTFQLENNGKFDVRLTNKLVNENTESEIYDTKRERRDRRRMLFTPLTWKEVQEGFGIFGNSYNAHLAVNSNAKPHHISEITTQGDDGARYVYAQPLYNTTQKEVTFAVGSSMTGDGLRPDCSDNNLVTYDAGDASTGNSKGLDNYYSATTTPAFVHSYLLSARLSSDYIDSDNIPGPSEGDLGNYHMFTYTEGFPYYWRTPMASDDHKASFSDGVRIDESDDKASYVYGEKELRYLSSIETKNYKVEFVLNTDNTDRGDARGVENEHGGLGSYSKRLEKIKLYSKGVEGTLKLIKTVHFVYEGTDDDDPNPEIFPLCQNTPNSSNGKLTLKSVYFTYEDSHRGKYSPYRFEYANNPAYDSRAMDRWGNYKPQVDCSVSSEPNNADYPYVNQLDASNNEYASAWHLSKIKLPSGGIIDIGYEADDYAYVQDKPAMQMFKIIGVYNGSEYLIHEDQTAPISISPDNALLFEVPQDLGSKYHDISNLLSGIDEVIYLRCMVNLKPGSSAPPGADEAGNYEPIPVYCKIDKSLMSVDPVNIDGNTVWVGILPLIDVQIADGGINVSPITKTAIQYGRLNASRIVYSENGDMPDMSNVSGIALSFLEELADFVIGSNLSELFQSSNATLYSRGLGHYILPRKSFVRLSNPDGHKIGGGSRVKSIRISDSWENAHTGSENAIYGQDYSYNLIDGRSSGVAAYEPMLGADENPFRMPIEYEIKNVMAPDEARFLEKPIGESFYPSPSVGYSRVTVSNYIPDGVSLTRHGTGKMVHEFYTAKDYPVIVKSTDLSANTIRHKSSPLSILNIFKAKSKDYLTTTQGFAIQTNDMHGKQKAQFVFKEGSEDAISSVEYFYQDQIDSGKKVPNNKVTVIKKDATVGQAEIGVHFDMVTDMRESISETHANGIQANVEDFILPFLPTPIFVHAPVPIPSSSEEITVFRSATNTKVIQRFGVLSKIVATDNTSVVETENLAYDEVTGEILVTRTKNNFRDEVYNVTIPAHWHYDGMGPAYKNIHYECSAPFSGGIASIANAPDYFVVGDELLTSTGRAWVTTVLQNEIHAVNKAGAGHNSSGIIKVLRSGRRNLSVTPISTITLMSNPLDYFHSNVFENVTQASAIEFSDEWGTFCDCFSKDNINLATQNRFVMGARGNWRPTRNYTYLTDRIQAYYNKNTNIRRDGVFQSFLPFYQQEDGEWIIDRQNWTWASEVTQITPFGNEVENKDALGRYSTAHFGYNHTLPIAVAANAGFGDIGFNNFEDYNSSSCNKIFGFTGGTLESNKSHSGRNSYKVTYESPASYGVYAWEDCSDKDDRLDLEVTEGNKVEVAKGNGVYQINIDVYLGSVSVASVTDKIITLTTSTNYLAKLTVTDSDGRKGEIIVEN